jgi:aspartyl-tRNA(Asn)/glutamyl-tRNA(Gln) amidotransferase subunit B
VINQQSVEWAVLAALALHFKMPKTSYFDRKSYFYPDLPKGFQISQYGATIGSNGYLLIDLKDHERRVRLERLHLEEDSAKLLHEADKSASYVDYNRAGTPLLEIVTKPDIQSPEEAKIFLQELRLVMRYLDISDADMEKGHLRCDANISLRPDPEYFKAFPKIKMQPYYPKTEIKNLNSFVAVEHALAYEIKRQAKLWDKGKQPEFSSTRGWDDKAGETKEQRGKEEKHDYRYFPEPDLPPLEFNKKFLDEIKKKLMELPHEKKERLEGQLGLTKYDAKILTDNKHLADFFEQVISELKAWLVSLEEIEGTEEEVWKKHKDKLVKKVANWIISRLLKLLNDKRIEIKESKITPENFAELITLIYQNKVNQNKAQVILEEMFNTGQDPSDIMAEKDLGQLSQSKDLERIINSVINNNPEIIKQYQAGKKTVLQYLIGQVMKETKGRADPKAVREMLAYKIK